MAYKFIGYNAARFPILAGTAAERTAIPFPHKDSSAGIEYWDTDNNNARWNSDGAKWIQTHAAGAALVEKPNMDAGERNPDSPSNSFISQSGEWNVFYQAPGPNTETLVNNAPTLVKFVGPNGVNATTGTITLRDAAATGGANVKDILAAGLGPNGRSYDGMKFTSGLTVQASNLADGITCLWRNM